MVGKLITHVLLFCFFIIVATGALTAKSGCQKQCGNVSIPYPFGIGSGCFLNEWFEVLCIKDNTIPLLRHIKQEVMEISVEAGTILVRNPITFWNCNRETRQSPSLEGSPFVFSQKNRFTAVGCGAFGLLISSKLSTNIAGYMSTCGETGNHSCSGINCCQKNIPLNLNSFKTTFHAVDGEKEKVCKYAFLVDQDWFMSNFTDIYSFKEMVDVPVLLEWELYYSAFDVFGTSFETNKSTWSNPKCYWDSVNFEYGCYRNSTCYTYYNDIATSSSVIFNQSRVECSCGWGFEGNPYLIEGCKDIDECKDDSNSCTQYGGVCQNDFGGYGCYYPSRNEHSVLNLIRIGIGSIIGLLFVLAGAWWLYKRMKEGGRVARLDGNREIELKGTENSNEASNVLIPLVASQPQLQ
ncbi:wall-associated receptor kinase-like 10 [Ziziphus jujuba]|nr:wall-associated receptor kinase-like 10 [Ziziphus jujuba]